MAVTRQNAQATNDKETGAAASKDLPSTSEVKYKATLEDILSNHWSDRERVQFGFLVLLLLFTFSRVECPCPKNYSGEDSWDDKKHTFPQPWVNVPSSQCATLA